MGYSLGQYNSVEELLMDFNMKEAKHCKTPLDVGRNIVEGSDAVLPTNGGESVLTIRKFQSLAGSLLWLSRCTRPDISFAVHRLTRKTHQPTKMTN